MYFAAILGSGARLSRLYQVTCIVLLQIEHYRQFMKGKNLNKFFSINSQVELPTPYLPIITQY